jgi:hypothetical protein
MGLLRRPRVAATSRRGSQNGVSRKHRRYASCSLKRMKRITSVVRFLIYGDRASYEVFFGLPPYMQKLLRSTRTMESIQATEAGYTIPASICHRLCTSRVSFARLRRRCVLAKLLNGKMCSMQSRCRCRSCSDHYTMPARLLDMSRQIFLGRRCHVNGRQYCPSR